MSDPESDDIVVVIRPPTDVAAASADQWNPRRKRHRQDSQHHGAFGLRCPVAFVSCFEGRWVEELALATEA